MAKIDWDIIKPPVASKNNIYQYQSPSSKEDINKQFQEQFEQQQPKEEGLDWGYIKPPVGAIVEFDESLTVNPNKPPNIAISLKALTIAWSSPELAALE